MLVGSITLILCSFSSCASAGSGDITGGQGTEPNEPQLPTTKAAIYGTITNIQNVPKRTSSQENTNQSDPNVPVSSDEATGKVRSPGDAVGVVLVEENPDEEYGSQKVYVTITKSTRLLDQQEQGLISADFEDFELGQQVRVWYRGPVAESYPGQATARVVVIENR